MSEQDRDLDGPEVVEIDGDQWWERGSTSHRRDNAANDYLDDFWQDEGFSFRPSKIEFGRGKTQSGLERRQEALVTAHGMVKTFVQTFATSRQGGDPVEYDVAFDPTAVAETDEGKRVIKISPAPVLDNTIDSKTAGRILTALACSEASHVRSGKDRWSAVSVSLVGMDPRKPEDLHRVVEARSVSNLLAGETDEAEFVRDFPGYADVFSPAKKYVVDSLTKQVDPFKTPLDVAISAVRYDEHLTWPADPEMQADREWWKDWAARYTQQNTIRSHVAGVNEALVHLREQEEQKQEQGQGDGQGQGNDQSGDGDGQGDSDGAPSGKPGGRSYGGVGDLGADVEQAAVSNGVSPRDINGLEADNLINDQLYVDGEPGEKVDHRPIEQLAGYRSAYTGTGPRPSGSASSKIRSALLASRTGRTGIERSQSRGRIDNPSLYRIAMQDDRLFHRRTSQDPGKYLVWLLIDRSGSMQGAATTQTIAVGKAFAEAFRYVDTMRLEIHGWTSPNVVKGGHHAPVDAGCYRVWASGESPERVDQLRSIQEGGTPDSSVLKWAGAAIKRAVKGTEQPVIVIASDGSGYLTKDMVDKVRKSGVRVISVAIGGGVRQDIYGERDIIPWQGSIEATAGPLARLLGRMVGS